MAASSSRGGDSNPAETPAEIPGFYYDSATNRYYSLTNAPAEFRAKVTTARTLEASQKALKKLHDDKEKIKRQEVTNNFASIFKRAQYDGHGMPASKIANKMTEFFSRRMNANIKSVADGIGLSIAPYTPSGAPWITHSIAEEPNSWYIGTYSLFGYNHCTVKVTPKKMHRGPDHQYWSLENIDQLILSPEMAHKFSYVQSGLLAPTSPPNSMTSTAAFLAVHQIGFSPESPSSLRYCLNVVPQQRAVSHRYGLNSSDLPLRNYPWSNLRMASDSSGNVDTSQQCLTPFFLEHLNVLASGYKETRGKLHQMHLQTFDLQYSSPLSYQTAPDTILLGYNNGIVRLSSFPAAYAPIPPSAPLVSTEAKVSQYTIRSVRFHPIRTEQFIVSGDECYLKLFDRRFWCKNGQAIPVLGYNGHISKTARHQISLDPTTDLLVASGSDGWVRFWNASTGALHDMMQPFAPNSDRRLPIQAYYCGNFCVDPKRPQTEALLVVDAFDLKAYFAGPEFGDISEVTSSLGGGV